MPHQPRSPAVPALVGVVLVLAAAGPAAADLDVAFVLDTTGSMSGELREVQERVRQLAVDLSLARDGERLRWGIVAYRDRGDAYVTRSLDLTDDIGAAEVFLDSLEAGGGGDGPEAVVAAVAAALWELSWDRSDGVERLVFLVGDAPPHLDYTDDPEPEDLITEARRARIVVNTIGCRSLPSSGVSFFRRLAYATEGSYQHIGRVRRSTPSNGVAEAIGRAVMGSAVGRELGVAWLGSTDATSDGIQVRQGGPEGVAQSRTGAGLEPCVLEVRLPAGLTLEQPPRVRLAPHGLRVELALTDGPGGAELYALTECPPATSPMDVVLGGAS